MARFISASWPCTQSEMFDDSVGLGYRWFGPFNQFVKIA